MEQTIISRRTAILAGATLAAAPGLSTRPARTLERPAAGGTNGWAVAADSCRLRTTFYEGRSPTLVFVHGWTCDRSYWNAQVERLRGGFSILTLDLVGHGESDRQRRDWSMDRLGDDVARTVIQANLDGVVLVGHSMGGPVAIEAARRLGQRVVGVMTVDILRTLDRAIAPPRPLEERDFPARVAADLRKYMFGAASDARQADRIVASMTSADPVMAVALSRALESYDPRPTLVAIRAIPLMMVYAAGGSIDLAGIERAHPRTRIAIVEKAGHFLMMEQPEAFNALLTAEVMRARGSIRLLA